MLRSDVGRVVLWSALATVLGGACVRTAAGTTSERLEILSELDRRDFAALDQRLVALHDAVEREPTREAEVRGAYAAFASSRPGIEEGIREWVETSPDSYAAHLALATHLSHRGWRARGGKWASETKENQFAEMNNAFAGAVASASKAIELKPRLTEAYAVAINIAMARSEREAAAKLAAEALDQVPESFRVRRTMMQSLLPRWGGSYEAMTRFAIESQRYADRNPRLKALPGFVAWDAGTMSVQQENYGLAVTLFSKALEAGESNEFYASRAGAHIRMNAYDRALADANEALRLQPDDVSVLANRAIAFAKAGQLDLAAADVRLATKLDPEEKDVVYSRDSVSSQLVNAGYELHKKGEYAAALVPLNDAVALNPGYQMAFYWRGQVYAQTGDLTRSESDLERSIELNPKHMDSYRMLDWVLGKGGRWDEVIARWNEFIALEPGNATGYLERAGTYRHKGDMTSAIADLETSCRLGNGNACQIVQQHASAGSGLSR